MDKIVGSVLISLIAAIVILSSLGMVLNAFVPSDPTKARSFVLGISGDRLILEGGGFLNEVEINQFSISKQNIQESENAVKINEEKLSKTLTQLSTLENVIVSLDNIGVIANQLSLNETSDTIRALRQNTTGPESIIKNLNSEIEEIKNELAFSKKTLAKAEEKFEDQVKTFTLDIKTEQDIILLQKELEIINNPVTVELDKKIYTWTEKVKISVTDLSSNQDPSVLEFIGSRPNDNITIKTSIGKLEKYQLAETGPNTGIFVGEIVLTGSGFIDGDLFADDIETRRITEGSGPKGGLLAVKNNDEITVTYTHEDSKSIGSAIIQWNLAKIHLDKEFYSYENEDSGTITLEDPDLDLDPTKKDSISVDLFSAATFTDLNILLEETDVNSGVFQGNFSISPFVTDHEKNILKVFIDDYVNVWFVDITIPANIDDDFFYGWISVSGLVT